VSIGCNEDMINCQASLRNKICCISLKHAKVACDFNSENDVKWNKLYIFHFSSCNMIYWT
jgi:hypothetical protein